ncbi:MAG: copper resistance protein CopC [Actinomycetota bacterium]|nr:copper resistance protein CopC [Actinomycetota bacterium]
MRRRALIVLLVAGAVVVATASAAGAHALVRSSDPANGAILSSSPGQVTVTFTEPPDPKLSFIHVLNEQGQPVESSAARPVADNELQWVVSVPKDLPDGVYTVSWRALSKSDGHVTAGSFSFGIGEAPTATTGQPSVSSSPPLSPVAVTGRWLLYWGLALLLSAGIVGILASGVGPPPRRILLAGSWVVAAVGLAVMTQSEASQIGVSIGALLNSSSGTKLILQAVGLVGLGGAVGMVMWQRSRATLAVMAAVAAVTMLLHAMDSHASSSGSLSWFDVGVQWIHLLAVGLWVGGLAWLVLATRKVEGPERATAIRRFSQMALVAVVVIAVTGVQRAISEVGTTRVVHGLVDTGFGVALLIKVALFVVLLVLAARNRYVNVPQVTAGTRRVGALRRTAGGELFLAAGVLAAAAVLSSLPPANQVNLQGPGTNQAAQPLVVTGNDFATTVKVRLTVTPGTVGPNTFQARVTDYDTGRPVDARGVQLRFSMPGRPDLGTPTLALERAADGLWTGRGTVISQFGTWDASVVVQRATTATEVPLKLQPKLPPQTVSVAEEKGQPTLYTITLPQGDSLQTYIDPGAPGPDVVHFTFFRASGSELPIGSATATALDPSGRPLDLKLIRFDRGHFAANLELTSGTWTFLIQANPSAGNPVSGYFRQTIGT